MREGRRPRRPRRPMLRLPNAFPSAKLPPLQMSEATATTVTRRDYSLVGRDTKLAEERGLANAEWYQCKISRARLKELMQRRDGPATRDSIIWFGLIFLSAGLGIYFWLAHNWWAA